VSVRWVIEMMKFTVISEMQKRVSGSSDLKDLLLRGVENVGTFVIDKGLIYWS